MKHSNENIGRGIATAGIWVSIAISAPFIMGFVIPVAFFAMLATLAVWNN